jgi:thioesterase domain-containing protein
LYGIQDPSLYDNQLASKSIEEMAARYLEVIKTVQPEGPYHLLGWSVGGVVAYEMAQQLSRQSQSVGILIMLDTNAPTLTRDFQPQLSLWDWYHRGASWVKEIPNRILGIGSAIVPITSYVRSGLFLLSASLNLNGGKVSKKPSVIDLIGWVKLDTWRTRLLKEADVKSTVSQEKSLLLIEMPDVRRILELVREHGRIVGRYTPVTYPGRITLFRATQSEPNKKGDKDPTMGWGLLAKGGVNVHLIRANHVALLVKPYIEILAQGLKNSLDQRSDCSTDSVKPR